MQHLTKKRMGKWKSFTGGQLVKVVVVRSIRFVASVDVVDGSFSFDKMTSGRINQSPPQLNSRVLDYGDYCVKKCEICNQHELHISLPVIFNILLLHSTAL